jgi:hypothetical protein
VENQVFINTAEVAIAGFSLVRFPQRIPRESFRMGFEKVANSAMRDMFELSAKEPILS